MAESGCLNVYDRGLPLSLQQLTNALFQDAYTYACYTTYVRLVRQGFVLRRRDPMDLESDGTDELFTRKTIKVELDSSVSTKASKYAKACETDEMFATASPSDLKPVGPNRLNEWIRPKTSTEGGATQPPILFNVFDDRNSDRTKQFRKRGAREPDFVLVVVLLGDDADFRINGRILSDFGLRQETKILLATVDNGDVYFQCVEVFSVPCIKYL
ncbi:unnamed protein product [Mesocestoides corti]|uniref:tRNA-splicing endonuclease subunit Sen54 N-terminal domain-containing protein n=1 Tax=Mesocestoides corti TaxID=53468 RepID=A0A3P6IBD5_MESCO|nr:unnamed protein product [Mesocestoides corti]